MRLYLLRHGESEANATGIIAGQLETSLTLKGEQQAVDAGEAIEDLGIEIDQIVSSPLTRALDTSKVIAETIGYPADKILQNPLLVERSFGELEGRSKSETGPLDEEIISENGGELDAEVRDRAEEFLEWARQQPVETMLVVSHNSFGRRLCAVIADVPSIEVENLVNAELIDLSDI